jgi:hypothetical protein
MKIARVGSKADIKLVSVAVEIRERLSWRSSLHGPYTCPESCPDYVFTKAE